MFILSLNVLLTHESKYQTQTQMLPKDKPVQCLKQDILANKLVNNCERFLIMQNACIQNILPPVNLQSCVDMVN